MIGLCSCANSEWHEFEVYSKMDEKQQAIDCEGLSSMVLEKKTSTGFVRHSHNVGLLDYMSDTDFTFNQCQDEIEQIRVSYCQEEVSHIVSNIRNGFDSIRADKQFLRFCNNDFMAALNLINDNYILPGDRRYFVILPEIEEMMLPSSIRKIRFSNVIINRLWRITLVTDDGSSLLHYSDKAKWEHALNDFASLETLTTGEE